MESISVQKTILRFVAKGFVGSTVLLLFYFVVVSLVSGWPFAQDQFSRFWYFIIALAVGFGIQIGLYTYLKDSVRGRGQTAKILAVSGTTSGVAMVSCCAHYLTNILPILGAAGLISLISQYQIRLFWIGLAFNFAGIIYMTSRILKFSKVV